MSGAKAALALAAMIVALPAATASAETPAQLAALASRARVDSQALHALRGIVRVDGQSVDIAAALEVRGSALAARLRTLATLADTRPDTLSGLSAARAARAIVAQRAFRGSTVPRPLHRPLSWLGDVLARVAHAFRPAVSWLAARIPGGVGTLLVLSAGLVALIAAATATGLGRRRGGRIVERDLRAQRAAAIDPQALERAADQAERGGEYEQALRLRFRSGLLRLTETGALRAPASLTNAEIAARLRSATFEGIAGGFDEVVYGDRTATREDVVGARSAWQRLLEEVGRP